jgi:predicted ester cyclase
MGEPANWRLIERFYHDMWNKFDKSVFPEILDPQIAFRGSLGQHKSGYRELGEYVDFIRAAFPDFHNEIVETISEGDKTFARLRYTGTHRGELFGIAPTGRKIRYAGAAVFTVRNGKICEVWVLGDIYGLLQQLQGRADGGR